MNKTEVDNVSEDETMEPAAKRPRLSSNKDYSNPQITQEDVTIQLSGACTKATDNIGQEATTSYINESALLSDKTTSQSQCYTFQSALHTEQSARTSSDNGSALLSDETTSQSQCSTSQSALHKEQTAVTSSDNGSTLLSDKTTSQSQCSTSKSALHTEQTAVTSSDNGSALLSDETTLQSQCATSQSTLHREQETMTSSASDFVIGEATHQSDESGVTYALQYEAATNAEVLENYTTIQVTPDNLQAASTQTNLLNRLPDCLPEEETNFLRFCHVILKEAEPAVRHRFDQKFPPDDLQSIIQKHKSTLLDLKIKRIITSSQWNLVFPTGSVPMSSTFDMTLMFCLFRHMTKISPKSGWYDSLPPPSDTSLGADLARIKYYRNSIAHYLENERKIDYAEFNIVWKDISETLGRIGGAEYAEKCSELLTTNLDSSHLDIYRDLCIQQQEMLKTIKEPVPYHEREKNKEEIANWQTKDAYFVETTAAKQLMKTLQQDKFVIVRGGPGTGKSFTAQHVLLTFRNTEYDIIPVKSSSDMIRYFSSKVHQIFYLDDFCGTCNILNNDIEEWERNKRELTKLFACTKTMCIFTCRSQIYQDSKFESLNLLHFKVIDLSGNHQLSLLEKKSVAQKYLDEEELKSLDDETISNSLCFPLLCSLYKKHADESIMFFEKPATCFRTELSELKKRPDKLKYACIALCVMLNNHVSFKVLTREVNTETKNMIEQVFEELDVIVTTTPKMFKSQFEAMVGSYFEKLDMGYQAIHDYLFDIFCSHVSETMLECIIHYADSALISNRALLQSLNLDNKSAIIIPQEFEHIFFKRIMKDIDAGKIVSVLRSHQMHYKSYREKFISFMNQQNPIVNFTNSTGSSALLMCSYLGYADLIEWLCDRGYNVNKCEKHIPVNQRTSADVLVKKRGNVNVSNTDGQTALYIASSRGHTDIVEILCMRRGDVNQCDKNGAAPLHVASNKGHSDIVKILCKRAININQCDNKGCTPLYIASHKGHSDITKILCDSGADTNQCNIYGWSPLFIASLEGKKACVQVLLNKGANVNDINKEGRSPLHVASQQGYSDIVTILCDGGGNVNVCDKDGHTPLVIAFYKKQKSCVEALLNKGANVNQWKQWNISLICSNTRKSWGYCRTIV